jgi:hypothetical protein
MAHHYLLIESLKYTLGLSSRDINELQNYRKKRSQSVYERTGVVTDTEASAALITARRLEEGLAIWLAAEHPELRLE